MTSNREDIGAGHDAPLTRRWLASVFFLSITFGVLCILPNVWQRIDTLYPFQGIEMMGTDQEHYYASRIGQVLEGDWIIADPYYGTQPASFIQPPFPEWVEGGLGILLGLDTARTVIAVKLVFGALLFLTMTVFFSRFTRRPWWSLFSVTAFLCAGFIFSAPQVLFSMLTDLHFGGEFLRFSRLTNPLFSTLLFFLALHAFLSWAQRGSIPALILTGVLTGLSFYAYPYTWMYLGAIFAVACMVFLFRRDWRRFCQMLGMGAVIFFIAAPYLYNQVAITHDPAYPDVLIRFVLLHVRRGVWGWWMALLPLLAFFPQSKRIFHPWWLLLALGSAAVIAMNQQLVTNLMIMPQHFHWYYILPLAVSCYGIFAGAVVVEPCARRLCSARVRSLGFVFGIIVSIGLGIRVQQLSYIAQRDLWGASQSMAPMFTYLREHVSPGVITFGWGFENELIPIYTSGDVANASNAPMCLCTHERSLNDYFFRLWLSGLSSQEAADTFFTSRRFEVSSNFRGSYYREVTGAYEGIPDDQVEYVLQSYQAFLALPTEKKITKYKLDYLVFPHNIISSLPHYSDLVRSATKAYEDQFFVVWKMHSV